MSALGCALSRLRGGGGFSIAVVVSKSGQVQESPGSDEPHQFSFLQPRLTSQKRSGTLAAKMDYQRRDDDEEDEALHLKIGDGSHDDAESSPPAAGECAEDMQAAAPALVSGKAEVTSPRVGRIGRFFKPRVLPWERRLHRRLCAGAKLLGIGSVEHHG